VKFNSVYASPFKKLASACRNAGFRMTLAAGDRLLAAGSKKAYTPGVSIYRAGATCPQRLHWKANPK
jgi:hypothetical protein